MAITSFVLVTLMLDLGMILYENIRSKSLRAGFYTRSNPNRGFTQAVHLRDSL